MVVSQSRYPGKENELKKYLVLHFYKNIIWFEKKIMYLPFLTDNMMVHAVIQRSFIAF